MPSPPPKITNFECRAKVHRLTRFVSLNRFRLWNKFIFFASRIKFGARARAPVNYLTKLNERDRVSEKLRRELSMSCLPFFVFVFGLVWLRTASQIMYNYAVLRHPQFLIRSLLIHLGCGEYFTAIVRRLIGLHEMKWQVNSVRERTRSRAHPQRVRVVMCSVHVRRELNNLISSNLAN